MQTKRQTSPLSTLFPAMASRHLRLLVLFFSWNLLLGFAASQDNYASVVSSYREQEISLGPFDWTYLRVELPPWFSSTTMNFLSDVNIDREQLKELPRSRLPVLCLKDGNPSIPDLSEEHLNNLLSNFLKNGSFMVAQRVFSMEQCIPFQENMTITLTNEQISPGVWYIAFFNGLGPSRTQSKMINRGKSYSIITSIIVEGCPSTSIWGPYCNQTIDMMSCSQPVQRKKPRNLMDLSMYSLGALNHRIRSEDHNEANQLLPRQKGATEKLVDNNNTSTLTIQSSIMCNNLNESSCLRHGELKFYFLDIVGIASQFEITAGAFHLNPMTLMNNTGNFSQVVLKCYVRYNAIPLKSSHDHSADISKEPLIIKSPKIGRWYIAVQVVNQTEVNGIIQEASLETNMCFSLEWQIFDCFNGKAGSGCSWDMYMLQRVPKRNPAVPYESYYLPLDEKASIGSNKFFLENLLSSSSVEEDAWTFFFLDIPRGAAGSVIHVQLISDMKVNYILYLKFGGLPLNDSWDYFASSTSSSNNSNLWILNDSHDKSISLYILYAREGTWGFGLKHSTNREKNPQTSMSISLEGCPRDCSHNGACHSQVDESGLTFYSYCSCNHNYGGFDCSIELVSQKGHMWQSIFLVGSNAAALLPAFWALHRKAFAEWVLFTSSGISSGLYHACDVGTWCILSFHVLQFMDFWLSFMAVVGTFIYMAAISEASKRAIHTGVFILTALLAVTGATRTANIGIVIAIGTVGLLIGWFLEFSTAQRFIYCLQSFDLNMSEWWQNIGSLFWNIVKTLKKRFQWRFLLLGFIALSLAATSWKLEAIDSYWIWHSLWHITIYTSSFFFLCSTLVERSNESQSPAYELARQDSFSRTGPREI
ncbi:uncharacterized protein [Typha angustifolia]|uniref:uncharacterized protein isoform X1 n=3 Tax=Typha angustifolia TaxID=59011 RepID=UPI003C2AD784